MECKARLRGLDRIISSKTIYLQHSSKVAQRLECCLSSEAQNSFRLQHAAPPSSPRVG